VIMNTNDALAAELSIPVETFVRKTLSWLRPKKQADEGHEIKKEFLETKTQDITDKILNKLHDYSRTSYYDRYYKSTGEKLQTSNQTKKNRFPIIYKRVKEILPDARRILSFGCSSGEEVFSLREHFPEAEIVGYDIDEWPVKNARRKNKFSNTYFIDELGPCGRFDAITCLMVLFAMEVKIPQKRWQLAIEKMDRHLNDGGVMFIHVSEYDPWTLLAGAYEKVSEYKHTHNKNGKEYFCGYYKKLPVGNFAVEIHMDDKENVKEEA
jgi:2-polyprenyl-3-methyl-5-hydroxy-6-metoxy-1,4-benzoquinol methylase